MIRAQPRFHGQFRQTHRLTQPITHVRDGLPRPPRWGAGSPAAAAGDVTRTRGLGLPGTRVGVRRVEQRPRQVPCRGAGGGVVAGLPCAAWWPGGGAGRASARSVVSRPCPVTEVMSSLGRRLPTCVSTTGNSALPRPWLDVAMCWTVSWSPTADKRPPEPTRSSAQWRCADSGRPRGRREVACGFENG